LEQVHYSSIFGVCSFFVRVTENNLAGRLIIGCDLHLSAKLKVERIKASLNPVVLALVMSKMISCEPTLNQAESGLADTVH